MGDRMSHFMIGTDHYSEYFGHFLVIGVLLVDILKTHMYGAVNSCWRSPQPSCAHAYWRRPQRSITILCYATIGIRFRVMLGSFTEMVCNRLIRVLCSVLARRNPPASARIGYSIITLVLGNAASLFTSVSEHYDVRYQRVCKL